MTTPPPPLPGPQTPGEGLPEIVPDQSYLRVPGNVPSRRETTDPGFAVLGDLVRTGRWQAARTTTFYSFMGNVKLDLREVVQPGETMEITAWAMMGDVRVIVPAGTEVEVRGSTIMGDGRTETDVAAQGAAPNGSRVVVTVYSLMGNVRVRCMSTDVVKPPSGWRWARPRP